MKNSVIVCEGIHDVSRIREVFKDAFCVITNGSEISKETLNMIKEYSKSNEIIIFTDPDSPGERIRGKILEVVPNASEAFLPKGRCISENKKKVGIEHASKEDIKKALSSYIKNDFTNDITLNDLYDLGLIGNDNSKVLRDKISSKLNIGLPNGKTFLKRISHYDITLDELKRIINDEK